MAYLILVTKKKLHFFTSHLPLVLDTESLFAPVLLVLRDILCPAIGSIVNKMDKKNLVQNPRWMDTKH